jgi:Polyketide cyclase / dehydrase and lipid transport
MRMSTTLCNATVTSSASPSAFFARWADMATWPDWNLDTQWVRLDGPFQTGATGLLKPKGGPKVPFVLTSVVPDREFVDVSKLLGARLTFRHDVHPHEDGGCTVDVTATIAGPLSWIWTLVLGKGLRASVQPDLDRLRALVERPQ